MTLPGWIAVTGTGGEQVHIQVVHIESVYPNPQASNTVIHAAFVYHYVSEPVAEVMRLIGASFPPIGSKAWNKRAPIRIDVKVPAPDFSEAE